MTVLAHVRLRSSVSPDADALLSPLLLSELLFTHGVSVAALTDINTALNCPAFAACCKEKGIAALYGLEALAKDGSALVLFDSLRLAVDFSRAWHRHLAPIAPEKSQYIVDENGAIIASVPKNLQMPSDVCVDSLHKTVSSLGGLLLKPQHYIACTHPAVVQDGIIQIDMGDEALFVHEKINVKAIRAGFEKWEAAQIQP